MKDRAGRFIGANELHDRARCRGRRQCDGKRSDNAVQPYHRMNAAVDYINQHDAEPIEMAQHAQVANLSYVNAPSSRGTS